jgi:serine/threonine protein kinase
MEDESDYESSEWEDVEIPSLWDWEKANTPRTVGGANNSNLMLCRRRRREQGSRWEPKLYVRKVLTRDSRRGMILVKRELEMLQRCEHRNILCYEDFSYKGKPWDDPTAKLFTEYCEQGDLEQFMVTKDGPNRKLSPELGVQVFSQLAQALLYIHHGISLTPGGFPCMAEFRADGTSSRNGDWETILHRDIKPSNGQSRNMFASRHDADQCAVFIAHLTRQSIHVKLGDFGLARLDTDKSQTYVGTREWLAPVSLLM